MRMGGMTPGPSHAIEIRVRFGETDPYGVAYFAAILDFFKRWMDEFLRSRGISPDHAYRNRKRNFGFPSWRPDAAIARPSGSTTSSRCAPASRGSRKTASPSASPSFARRRGRTSSPRKGMYLAGPLTRPGKRYPCPPN